MAEIRIEHVESKSNVLRGEIECSSKLRRFFSGEDFLVEYSVDVSDVPESVLTIPVLAHVCPIAWTQNADVSVGTVDARFEESLRDARDELMQMYPTFLQGGKLRYEESREAEPTEELAESGLLFTRGVDSTFSYLKHRDESPALITVQGWTFPDHEYEKWERLTSELEAFGSDRGVENHFVRSNMLSFYNYGMVQAHCKPHVDGAWYSSVGHGIGLLGLCAPLAYADGIGDLYMAATHWEGVSLPWGSRPPIDDNVAWAGTRCHHDGYELTRQERLEAFAERVREEELDLELRTCNERIVTNCNNCEKCYRTAVGLLMAGLDPNDHGYSFDAESFGDIRRGFESEEWRLGQHERIMWEDLQSHVRRDSSDTYGMADQLYETADQFFDWVRETDFSDFVKNPRAPPRTRLLRKVYRDTPYWIYNVMYPTYRKIKRQRRLRRVGGENWRDWRTEALEASNE